jgi:hypothetical protein
MMPKSWFNEPELYLLKKWTDAQLLEESMKAVRKKYAELFEKILEQVQESHEELDCPGIQPTGDGGLNLGLGKSTWPSKWPKWPSGLWLGPLRIEDLVAEDGETPGGSIWLYPPSEVALDISEAARKFQEAAPSILTKEELDRTDLEEPEEGYAHVNYSFPQSRQEVLDLLLKDDATDFIQCMVGHFETLANFIPVIDDIFQHGERKKK